MKTLLNFSARRESTAYVVLIAAMVASAASALAVTIQTVPVGNPGNAPDPRNNILSVGSVDHAYQIGKYEVTAGQFTEFLNAVAKADPNGLYNTNMSDPTGVLGANIQRSGSYPNFSYSVAADWANRPVNYVSFWDSVRFANWLNNGQPTGSQGPGTTEDGAYHDVGNQTLFGRNAGARFFIPTEDEWCKAAYHKNDGVTGNYWDYPTASNTAPINTLPDPGNHANFDDLAGTGNNSYTIGSPYYRTEAGAFANSASPYGTFDQGGNVWEWNETMTGAGFGRRGGSFLYGSFSLLASYYTYDGPTSENSDLGFRVAASVLPGDFNHDGLVDAADYVTWRKGLGTTYTQPAYDVWRAHFSQSAGSGAALPSAEPLSAVPEPATPLLLLLGICVAGACHWRRSVIKPLIASVVLRTCAFVLVLLLGAAAASAQTYHLTDLDPLGSNYGYASAINNSGQVVGSFVTGDVNGAGGILHAFLYSGRVMTDLGMLPGDSGSAATGINARGQVVGFGVTNLGTISNAFLFSDGVLSDLGTLPGEVSSYASGINDRGEIVGASATTNDDSHVHAFIYSGGKMTDLGTLGGSYSSATAINARGEIIGVANTVGDTSTHGFLYSHGTMTDLDFLPVAINARGDVVCNDSHFYSHGTLTQIGIAPIGLNDRGQVVGIVGTWDNPQAALYSDGNSISLETVVDSSAAGWRLEYATAINNAGSIVGQGKTPGGLSHAFLLTPVTGTTAGALMTVGIPEPSMFVLAAAGFISIVSIARRRA
jgi:sulfatase modifying factor 1